MAAVEKLAKRKGVTTAQVAMGWVLGQGAIPIPGSTNVGRIEENNGSPELTKEEMDELKQIMETMPIAGQRYGGPHEKFLNA